MTTTRTRFVSGWLYDVTGDYDVPYYMAGIVQSFAALVFLTIYTLRCRSRRKLIMQKDIIPEARETGQWDEEVI